MSRFPMAVTASVLVCLAGCATITEGTSQAVRFHLEPKEAACTLSRVDDGELGSVNAAASTLKVSKDKDDIVIRCKAPGYQPTTARLASKATEAGIRGIALDFGITDMITGAMYAYPAEVTIAMRKAPQAKAEAAKAFTP